MDYPSTSRIIDVYLSVGHLVGSHTADLLGDTDRECGGVYTDEQVKAGEDACEGLCRAITSKGNGPIETSSDFCDCVMQFCLDTSEYINKNKDRFSSPKEFLMHVTGYAVLTSQDWDEAFNDVLNG